MQPGQQQRRTNEDECPHLAARQLEVFGTVGKPLPTSSEDGASTPMLMKMSGHVSVRSLGKYARPSAEALARWGAETDPAPRGRR